MGDPKLLRLQRDLEAAFGYRPVAELLDEIRVELAMRVQVWGGSSPGYPAFADPRHQRSYDRLASVADLLRSNGSTLDRYIEHMRDAIKPRSFDDLLTETRRELTMRVRLWNGFKSGSRYRFDRSDHQRRYDALDAIRLGLEVLAPHFAAPDLFAGMEEGA